MSKFRVVMEFVGFDDEECEYYPYTVVDAVVFGEGFAKELKGLLQDYYAGEYSHLEITEIHE